MTLYVNVCAGQQMSPEPVLGGDMTSPGYGSGANAGRMVGAKPVARVVAQQLLPDTSTVDSKQQVLVAQTSAGQQVCP